MRLDAVDGRSLRSGFLEHAARRPELPALVVGDSTLSYGDLAARARRIASAITRSGTHPIERVGVFAYRSEVAYSATLGALCAGAAFVPLNQRFPVQRTAAMAQRARLSAIVVDKSSAAQLPAVLAGLDEPPPIIAPEPEIARSLEASGVPVMTAADFATHEPIVDLPPVLADDIAYLLFTSGTTGEPKGVGVTHANVLHYLRVMQQRYQLTSSDRCSQTFDQTFDLSVHDLFMTWNAGATLYAMQPIELLAPVRFVNKHELTVWFSVPSAVAVTIKRGQLQPGGMPSLRYSLFCGEPLPNASASTWQQAAPSSAIENLYGPTELTIACMVYRWDGERSTAESVNGLVPIGRPLPGLAALLQSDASESGGSAGELLVCGPQTAPGYWLDSAKTAERFVEVSVSPTRVKRFYRTGDRVRRLPSGDYAYLGRGDDQIKVLGFRVELGEIDAVLMCVGGAVQAAAVAWPIEDGRALGIVAFVSGVAEGITPDALVRLAATKLPNYMVPSRVLIIDDMPLNANGKIDRRQLALSLASA